MRSIAVSICIKPAPQRIDAQRFQLMTGSITVATGLLTLFAAPPKDSGNFSMPIALYYVPFAIMLPAL